MSLLTIEGLRKEYRAPDGTVEPVLDLPHFELAAGEQVGLVGSSGSGKTTLLNLIAGILRPEAGTLRLAGTDVAQLSEAERDRFRAEHVGYVFQTFNLLQGYTALENVLLGMLFGRGADAGEARDLLQRLGLGDRMNYRPRQLSVGQQQRVALARALAGKPQLILADEPTGNLDPARAKDALALLQDSCRERGAALLLVTHDRGSLGDFDRVVDLAEIATGSRREPQGTPSAGGDA